MEIRRCLTLLCLGVAFGAGACTRPPEPAKPPPKDAFMAAYQRWRQERVHKLKAEKGWLSVAGLFWLKEGENRVGSDPDGEIVFPERAPKSIGVVERSGGKLTFRASQGIEVTCRGSPASELELHPDGDPAVPPDELVVGPFTFLAIARGGRLGIRLYDEQAPARRHSQAIPAFPADPAWVVRGVWMPYEPPRKVSVHTVIQTIEEATIPGVVIFEIEGKELRLEPEQEPGTYELFFVFGDTTNGKETYGGGRFLTAELGPDGTVVLDFNRAINPPCAFTPYATCPIPRPENRLPVAIRAGEMALPHP
jgi:hypothetical protein